jgi:hypothetical protein
MKYLFLLLLPLQLFGAINGGSPIGGPPLGALSNTATNTINTFISPSWARFISGFMTSPIHPAGNQPLMLISLGDSVAGESSASMFNSMIDTWSRSYIKVGSELCNPSNTRRVIPTGTVKQMVPDAFWFSTWYALSTGGTITEQNDWNANGLFVNQVKLYYIKHPGGGAFRLQQSTFGGAFSDIASLNGFNATPIGAVATVTISQTMAKFQVVSDSSTNYIIGFGDNFSGLTQGFITTFLTADGIPLTEIQSVPRAIRDPILAGICANSGGGMILVHMKEDSTASTDLAQRDVATWLNTVSNLNMVVVWVGTSPLAADTNTFPPYTVAQNFLIRSNAYVHNQSFFDAYKYFVNYPLMLTNGLNTDGTHPSQQASDYMAAMFMNEFGCNILPNSSSWRHAPIVVDYHGFGAPQVAGDPGAGITSYYGNQGGSTTIQLADGIRFQGFAGDGLFAFLGDANWVYLNAPSSGSGGITFQAANLNRTMGRVYLSGGTYLGAAGTDPGIGNLIVDKGLGVAGATATKTSAYTATVADFYIPCDTTTGFTVTLPATPNNGQVLTIKKITADANTLTIGSNGKNINGAASKTITAQWGTYVLYYTGTTWNVLSSGTFN